MVRGPDQQEWIFIYLSIKAGQNKKLNVRKEKILNRTVRRERSLAGSADESLTPSNVKAEQHSTYGSADLQATQANESVLFFQRGAEKMRELAFNWELDSYVAPDMTILVPEITGDGITNADFQQTPNSILWCVKENGEIATFVYERKENITSWSTQITDGDFESVAVISGSAEDQVWVSVERVIDSSTVRYIEYFALRDYGLSDSDAFYVDCGATYTDVSSITDLDWLEGEVVRSLADGVSLAKQTVSSGTITLSDTYTTYQVGLSVIVQMKTMPLSWTGTGFTIQGRIKRISEVAFRWYNSGTFSVGKSADNKQLYTIDGITDGIDRLTFPPGYDRDGYVFIYQDSAKPLTLLALMIEFNVN